MSYVSFEIIRDAISSKPILVILLSSAACQYVGFAVTTTTLNQTKDLAVYFFLNLIFIIFRHVNAYNWYAHNNM